MIAADSLRALASVAPQDYPMPVDLPRTHAPAPAAAPRGRGRGRRRAREEEEEEERGCDDGHDRYSGDEESNLSELEEPEGQPLVAVGDRLSVLWASPAGWFECTVTEIRADVGRKWAVRVRYDPEEDGSVDEPYHHLDGSESVEWARVTPPSNTSSAGGSARANRSRGRSRGQGG
jgi:hypothetical protein